MNTPTIDKEQVRWIAGVLDRLKEDVAHFPVFPLGENTGPFTDSQWETVGRLVNAAKGPPSKADAEQPSAVDGHTPAGEPSQDRQTEKSDQAAVAAGANDMAATSPPVPATPATRPVALPDLQTFKDSDATATTDASCAASGILAAPAQEATIASKREQQSAKCPDHPTEQQMKSPTEEVATVLPEIQAPEAQPHTDGPQNIPTPAQPATPLAAPMPKAFIKTQTLPNAMVGRPFSAEVGFSDSQILAVRDVEAPELADLGLTFDPDTRVLSGVPTKDGDHTLQIVAAIEGPSPGHIQTVRWTGALTVNPDPKSLWRNEPSDQSDVDWKEDEAKETVTTEKHLLIAASKRGRSHAHTGLFRDDDVAIGHDPQFGWNVLVVADGAGSAPKSRKGSQIAVMTAKQELLSALPAKFGLSIHDLVSDYRKGDPKADAELRKDLYIVLAKAAYQAYAAIHAHAKRTGEPIKAFSTTLVMAIHIETSAGHLVAGFGIGDGGAALLDLEGGTVHALTKADGGEFAGQTRFLSREEFGASEEAKARLAQRLHFVAVDKFTALVAMTDGVTDPMFPTDAAFESIETWRKFWAEDLDPAVGISTRTEGAEDRLLEWLNFWSQGNHDDRTIAVLV